MANETLDLLEEINRDTESTDAAAGGPKEPAETTTTPVQRERSMQPRAIILGVALAFAVVLIFIMVGGSLWIMFDLYHRMMV